MSSSIVAVSRKEISSQVTLCLQIFVMLKKEMTRALKQTCITIPNIATDFQHTCMSLVIFQDFLHIQ